ncbi:MAG: peptide chain release factor 2 [Oligoflexales bacterium]|nr:peptide chain release factor 2 [Oligoflexales bacterium]
MEDEIAANPDFWSDPKKSAPILKEKKQLELTIDQAKKLDSMKADLSAALDLAQEGESEYLSEAETILADLESYLKFLEIQSMLSGELDHSDALVTINAGAGGTESCDWASMLFRMYLRFAEIKGWTTEIFDILDGEEAGIKNVTFGVSGKFAFGLLKAESGVHRLVRISPFDSNARRHTSFASVYVSAVIDDEIDIEINPVDIKVDTYRSSGAGGQHVNKTDSAVRMTHLPSGIIVQCQTQRSQHQNRDQCLKLLKSKLYEKEMEKRRKQQESIEGAKSDIGWGSQIRSYVLHPYKMVKDHRTNFEHHDPDEILNGKIECFINEWLAKTLISS